MEWIFQPEPATRSSHSSCFHSHILILYPGGINTKSINLIIFIFQIFGTTNFSISLLFRLRTRYNDRRGRRFSAKRSIRQNRILLSFYSPPVLFESFHARFRRIERNCQVDAPWVLYNKRVRSNLS